MNITDRELSNLLERFFVKHCEYLEGEDKLILPKGKQNIIDYLMELTPTDIDYRDYAKAIIKDINSIKGKWII
jgi:hypothetical protein